MKNQLSIAKKGKLNPQDSFSKEFKFRLESKWYKVISHLFSELTYATANFFKKYDFIQIPLPVTCHSISSPFGLGSDSKPVKIDLFNAQTYLADSMQFHLEVILRQGFTGAYYIMPTFRGEECDSRHLSQFFHSELEMQGGLDEVMKMVENYIKSCAAHLLKKCASMIKEVAKDISHLQKMASPSYTIPSISFEEAIYLLNKEEFFKKVEGRIVSISPSGEQALIKDFGGAVWVHHYPIYSVPFYQAWDKDKRFAKCADLLIGIGETVGCGERHVSYQETKEALYHHKVDLDEYRWYLELKKDYPLLTSGFGMGLERFILWVLRYDDIRDIHLFNRMQGSNNIP